LNSGLDEKETAALGMAVKNRNIGFVNILEFKIL